MTAIFAYASGDVAFVCADTRRVIPAFGVVTACKVHRWSDTVVLAQAGDGKFQSAMIEALRTAQPMLGFDYSSLPEDERLLRGFEGMWPSHYQKAVASVANLKSGAAHITGTILVAAAADPFGVARIHKLDFATGKHSRVSSETIADGTDPFLFTQTAQTLLGTMRPSSGLFQIDEWGKRCVEQCVKSHPSQVDWPADIILARGAKGERISVSRRLFGAGASTNLLEFAV